MTRTTILSLLLLCLIAQRQQAQVGFNIRYDQWDSLWADSGLDIELHDSGYVVFNVTKYQDSVQMTNTASSVTVNLQGDRIAQRVYYRYYASSYLGFANAVDRTSDGGYIIGGSLDSIGGVNYVMLLRLNGMADTIWTRTWGDGIEDWVGRQVKATLDGGFIVAGSTGASGFIDGLALKTDSLGNEEWLQLYGGGGLTISWQLI